MPDVSAEQIWACDILLIMTALQKLHSWINWNLVKSTLKGSIVDECMFIRFLWTCSRFDLSPFQPYPGLIEHALFRYTGCGENYTTKFFCSFLSDRWEIQTTKIPCNFDQLLLLHSSSHTVYGVEIYANTCKWFLKVLILLNIKILVISSADCWII